MNSIIAFISQHPYIVGGAITFLSNYVWSAFIGALPAPTKDSSGPYRFFFTFLNLLAANIARARSTTIESSPNWKDALAKQQSSGPK
jgi:hypothetical protein